MELRDINLNLLLSLEALLETAHVTRAAERLGVTQSAMSHALKQLRTHFGDPLLVRGAKGLVPTPRAERLAVALRRGFAEIRRGLSEGAETLDAARAFTLVAPDHVACVLLPTLAERLAVRAPGSHLSVRALDPRFYAEQLEVGEVDLVLSVETPRAPGLRARRLFDDEFACAVRREHPSIKARLSLPQYASAQHIVHSPTGRGQSSVDLALEQLGATREISLRVPSLLVAMHAVSRSDYLVTASRRFLERVAPDLDLRVLGLPLNLGRFRAYALWHERFDQDPGQQALRACVAEAARAKP